MAAITLADAQAQLAAWLAASAAAATSQSYEIAGRKLTRANSSEILEQVKYWQAQCDALGPASGRHRRARTVVVGF